MVRGGGDGRTVGTVGVVSVRGGVRELSVDRGQPCVVMPWRRASCRVAGGGSGGRAGSVGEMPRAAGVVVNLFLMQRIESGLVADASAMASSATARRVKSFVIVVVISGCLKQLTPQIRCQAVPQQPFFLGHARRSSPLSLVSWCAPDDFNARSAVGRGAFA